MKIYLGSDHAGYELKEYLKTFLLSEVGCDVEDKGAMMFVSTDDYPDLIKPVAEAVAYDRAHGIENVGIILGRTGQGEAMVANRVKGIRCAVYYGGPQDVVMLSRTHNDANMLSLGGQFLTQEECKTIVKLWLATNFSGDERHIRRIGKF